MPTLRPAAVPAALLPGPTLAQTVAPERAKPSFARLSDRGRACPKPATIFPGLSGMGGAPAEVGRAATGHHHLPIDRPPPSEGEFGAGEFALAVPADDNRCHFGGGLTRTTPDLPAGGHSLQRVLGDHGDVPHDPPEVSDRIVAVLQERAALSAGRGRSAPRRASRP